MASYQQQGLYDQALELYNSVLETKVRVVGHNHIVFASLFFPVFAYTNPMFLLCRPRVVVVAIQGYEHPLAFAFLFFIQPRLRSSLETTTC